MHAKYMWEKEIEREKVKPLWISSHPLQSDDEYFMGRFQNCSFPFYLFSSRGGICGRGVFSISVLGTYFLWPAICPVYVCSLTCLSLLSTVEKDYIHKKEQITIQGQKKNKNQTHRLSSAIQSSSLAIYFREESWNALWVAIRLDRAQLAAGCLSVSRQVH